MNTVFPPSITRYYTFDGRQESIKNTLLFLSTKESLQLFTSLKSNLPLPGNDKYNW